MNQLSLLTYALQWMLANCVNMVSPIRLRSRALADSSRKKLAQGRETGVFTSDAIDSTHRQRPCHRLLEFRSTHGLKNRALHVAQDLCRNAAKKALRPLREGFASALP